MEALRRIFKVSDVDKDGLLNAMELNQFQVGRSPDVMSFSLRRGPASKNAFPPHYSYKSSKASWTSYEHTTLRACSQS